MTARIVDNLSVSICTFGKVYGKGSAPYIAVVLVGDVAVSSIPFYAGVADGSTLELFGKTGKTIGMVHAIAPRSICDPCGAVGATTQDVADAIVRERV